MNLEHKSVFAGKGQRKIYSSKVFSVYCLLLSIDIFWHLDIKIFRKILCCLIKLFVEILSSIFYR